MKLQGFARQLAAAVAGLGLLTAAAEAASTGLEPANDEGRSRTPGVDESRPSMSRATYERGPVSRGDLKEEDRYEGRGNSSYCREYARQAYRAAQINEERDCGFTGSRWHLRQSSHYQWCMRVPRQRAESETEARRDQLRRCRVGETGDNRGFCDDYARRAVRAQRINERLDCGFTGYRWTSNFRTHYDFCVNSSRQRVVRVSQAREEQLTRCRQPY